MKTTQDEKSGEGSLDENTFLHAEVPVVWNELKLFLFSSELCILMFRPFQRERDKLNVCKNKKNKRRRGESELKSLKSQFDAGAASILEKQRSLKKKKTKLVRLSGLKIGLKKERVEPLKAPLSQVHQSADRLRWIQGHESKNLLGFKNESVRGNRTLGQCLLLVSSGPELEMPFCGWLEPEPRP